MFAKLRNKKYLSHTYAYEVDGEELPEKKKRVNRKALLISLSITLCLFLVLNFMFVGFKDLISAIGNLEAETPSLFDIMAVDWGQSFQVTNVFRLEFNYQIYFVIIGVSLLLSMLIYSKMNYKSEEVLAYGQKGDSRFTTIEEIREQYKEIPEREKPFKGVGGIPVSHYKNKYYIDVDTVNSCILGASRSGKGETLIFPMIDILSRAEEKASMVLNDPKGELYASSKDTLEERGYDVEVLNIKDPLQSMSYNPLEQVKEAWLEGNPEEAGKRANSIAYTLYNDPEAGENAFFNDGAQNAVTAIILALVEYCYDNGCPEKITMYNVAEMLNELGTLYYKDDPNDPFSEKNALDEFFKNLPQGHVAKKRYGSTSFAGEKTRGSILSTANQGLQPFSDPLFAKMTSKNSIDLKQLGFPKSLTGQLDKRFVNERIQLSFHKNNQEKTEIGKYRIKVKALGFYALNFNDRLEDGDLILIKYESEETYKIIYQIHFEEQLDEQGNVIYRKEKGYEKEPEMSRDVTIVERVNTFPEVKRKLTMRYSDKPTAVFMIIPDYDSSNHMLASIFTKQLYTNLAMNCDLTKGNKCFTRVQFILDEFGNMPPIDEMDQVMTVCLGRNILFNLVVQSYTQIKRKYGEGSETIKENCQNHLLIMSTNVDTIEELSKKAGHTTVISHSSNESHLDMDNKITKSADQVRIVTADRLSQLIQGEMLLIRPLHRQDNNRRKVRPYPIFNTRETNMPSRYQFLSKWFDTSKDMNQIDIWSEHTYLDLRDLNVNFADFIINKDAKSQYAKTNQQENIYKEPVVTEENVATKKSKEKISKEMETIIDLSLLLSGVNIQNHHYKQLIKMVKGYRETKRLLSNGQLNEIITNINDDAVIETIRILMEVREN